MGWDEKVIFADALTFFQDLNCVRILMNLPSLFTFLLVSCGDVAVTVDDDDGLHLDRFSLQRVAEGKGQTLRSLYGRTRISRQD